MSNTPRTVYEGLMRLPDESSESNQPVLARVIATLELDADIHICVPTDPEGEWKNGIALAFGLTRNGHQQEVHVTLWPENGQLSWKTSIGTKMLPYCIVRSLNRPLVSHEEALAQDD